jgi:hypothetical protein
MNNPQIPSGLWRKQKARMKMMFPSLTDDDFKYEYGLKEVMMTHLEKKLQKSRSELNELFTPSNTKKFQTKYQKSGTF